MSSNKIEHIVTRPFIKQLSLGLLLALLVILPGCSRQVLSVDHKPKHEPLFNFTQSSKILSCVGGLIETINGAPIDIFISNIPDHTTPSIESGFLTKNAVMMVTTAVDRLGTRRVAVVGANGGIPGRRQMQILGAFTELNRTTQSNALSGDFVFPGDIELELGGDQSYNHIALDLALSENNRIVPNTSTSVSIHLYGSDGDTTLTFDDDDNNYAAAIALGFSGQEGFHASSRLLVETSVAIMMSRVYELDIKDCLNRAKRPEAPVSPGSYDQPIFKTESDERAEEKKYDAENSAPVPLSVNSVESSTHSSNVAYVKRSNGEVVYTQDKKTSSAFSGVKNSNIIGREIEEEEPILVLPRSKSRRFIPRNSGGSAQPKNPSYATEESPPPQEYKPEQQYPLNY